MPHSTQISMTIKIKAISSEKDSLSADSRAAQDTRAGETYRDIPGQKARPIPQIAIGSGPGNMHLSTSQKTWEVWAGY